MNNAARRLWLAPIGCSLLLACGGGSWKSRLEERFATVAVEHPLTDEARIAHQHALAAEENQRNNEARTWALAADRFLSAAIVQKRNELLEKRLADGRARQATLTAKVAELERMLHERFTVDQASVRSRWVEDAKRQSYEHAADYEQKRFRARNEDAVRLKMARDELVTLATLQLEGARALAAGKPLAENEAELRRCAKVPEALEALDCVNQVRWQVQEAFSTARGRFGLSSEDTSQILKTLETRRFAFYWQNDAIAIVEQNKSPKAWQALLEEVTGPVQVHGSKKDVSRMERVLRSAGLPDDRAAKSVIDDLDKAVVYLLAYPRP